MKASIWWWWCYPTPSEGWGCGGTPWRPNSLVTPQGLDHTQRWRAGEVRMRDSQGGGESNPADGVRRHCVRNSPSFLSCIDQRTIKGCDHGSDVETVHSG